MKPLVAFAGLLALLVVGFGTAVVLHRQLGSRTSLTPAEVAGTQLPNGGGSHTGNQNTDMGAALLETPFARTPAEREVEAALYRFLSVYADALLNLETSRLPEVLAGDALRWVTDEVNDLKAQGRPAKVIEDDRVLTFLKVSDSEASVEDRYVSRGVYLDPQTRQPIPRESPALRVRQTYELRRTPEGWKVIGGSRNVLGEVQT